MNANHMVTGPASCSQQGVGHGAVIVSLQRTKLDNQASVRIFARWDDIARLLAQELCLTVRPPQVSTVYQLVIPDTAQDDDANDGPRCFFVLYHSTTGQLLTVAGTQSSSSTTSISTTRDRDLSTGSEQQGDPCSHHTRPTHEGDSEVVKRDRHRHFEICFMDQLKKTSTFRVPFLRKMGAWWVEAEVRLGGQISRLLIVNVPEHDSSE